MSSARRTASTWLALAEGGSFEAEATYSEALYAAGPETALDLVRETDDDVTALVVVGHNPTMAYLAQLLDDGTGDEEAGRQMATGFPTGALARLRGDRAVGRPRPGLRPPGRLPRRSRLTPTLGQTGGAGVTTPCSASRASISSRLMPRRYMIASR